MEQWKAVAVSVDYWIESEQMKRNCVYFIEIKRKQGKWRERERERRGKRVHLK